MKIKLKNENGDLQCLEGKGEVFLYVNEITDGVHDVNGGCSITIKENDEFTSRAIVTLEKWEVQNLIEQICYRDISRLLKTIIKNVG